ncbi:MAG: cadherin-like domain-containing protein [Gammaproteobacteria bacterium]|nr:cadherin-like domain-containing protein [Gammaproteobacteria bacterium]
MTSVVEDRFLVTDAAHLLVGEAEGARLVDVGAARHGSVEVQANGDIHFIPDPDFAGEAGFLYRVELPDGLIVERQALIAVTEVNDAPAAVDDTLAGIEDGSIDLGAVLSNDRDADGDALRVVAVGQVEHGRVTGDAASGFRFVPDPHFHGEVQLVYVVEDGAGARSVARATLTIAEGANDAPEVTHGVVAAGLEDTPLVLHEDALLAAVTDPEGDVVSIEGVRAASGGEVHFDRNTGEVTFLPDADFHGEAELQIDVVDARGARGSGTMAVRIENALDPIVAGGAQVSVPGGTVTVIPEQALLAALAIDNPDGGARSGWWGRAWCRARRGA